MPGLLDNRGPYSGYDPKKDKYLLGQPKQTDFTGAGNFYKGLASGALGLPADLLQMMSDAAAAGYTPGRKSLQIPLTSDKIGGLLGADVSQDAFKSGLLGSPDPGDLARMGGKGLLAMTLFHGTPHKFDKFDLAKIGTGEGAQAYGHGLYFAENPGVARGYKSDLSGFDELFIQTKTGKKIGEDLDDVDIEIAKALELGAADAGQFPHNTVYYAKRNLSGEALERLESYGPSAKAGYQKNTGHLYEVNIPDDVTAKMLDWDAPLSEQPENIKQLLKTAFPKELEASPFSTGRQFYQRMAGSHLLPSEFRGRGEEGVSDFLNKAGIKGIRYLDAGSRGGKEGTRNIVLFDPDTITEVKRDGSLVYENKLGLKK